MIRVLIADDHPIFRRGLKEILVTEIRGAKCGEATNAEEALEQIRSQSWDLLILDLTMRGRNGLAVLEELRREQPKLPVLVLSMHPERQYGPRTLKAGASGYLNKDTASEELIKAVQKVLAGGCYVSPALAESLALSLSVETNRPLHERLSNRELEVLCMIASGQAISKIADQLRLSVKTVSTYRVRILEKLVLTTTAELIRYALDNHLVQ